MELVKIIDHLDEIEQEIEDAMKEIESASQKTRMVMASSDCKNAIRIIRGVIRTQKEMKKG